MGRVVWSWPELRAAEQRKWGDVVNVSVLRTEVHSQRWSFVLTLLEVAMPFCPFGRPGFGKVLGAPLELVHLGQDLAKTQKVGLVLLQRASGCRQRKTLMPRRWSC